MTLCLTFLVKPHSRHVLQITFIYLKFKIILLLSKNLIKSGYSRSSVQGETTSPSTKPIYQLFDQTDDVRPHRRIQTDDGSSIATSLLEDKTLEGAQVLQIVFLAIRSSVGRRLR